jgi:hypothetical protein
MACLKRINDIVCGPEIRLAPKSSGAGLDGPVNESDSRVKLTVCRKEARNVIAHKYLTQKEVADLFRVQPSTVKNWRDAGLLEYFQPPGSTRVLYPRESVEALERQHTKKKAKVIPFRKPAEVKRIKPEVSSNPKKVWRI